MLTEMDIPAMESEVLKRPDLPQNVRDELVDEKYKTLKHYSRATYAKGCHGPLCRLAERDRGRSVRELEATTAGREYTPNEQERARRAEGKPEDKFLYAIVRDHHTEHELRAMERRAQRRWGPFV